MRKIINLNPNWTFSRQESQIEEVMSTYQTWSSLSLPHTWNAIDGTTGKEYDRGAYWYAKSLTLPKEDQEKSVFIEFKGANSVTDVYLNGEYLGQHRGGYSIFRFDLTNHFRFGEENILAVKVDNSAIVDIYPLRADFTFFGGIYRDVNLLVVNPTHVDLMDYGSQGAYIVQEDVTSENADIKLKTIITNHLSEEEKVRLWIEVYDQDETLVSYCASEVILDGKETRVIELDMRIEKPRLWNGIKDPHMYKAKITLQKHNDTVDELSVPFGLRYFHVDPDSGFYLNGHSHRLNGVSRHQDRKDKGWAISKEDQQDDMELIKDIGATSIRLAHYQHDSYFYDLCDQEGMVVWAEIPFITQVSETDLTGENAKVQLTELIRQNYNHPSIMFWGIQNEIQIDSKRDKEARQIVKELNDLAKQEDATRLTTMANLFLVDEKDEYNFMTDIIGYNKYYGWYTGKAEDFADWIDLFRAKNPTTSLGISEYGAEGIIDYHSDNPVVKDYSEEYHALYHEKVLDIFADRPYLWSTYVWNMFDFGANIRDEGGVKGRNNKGLVTYDRKIKKDAFYIYKAHWSKQPFVHITGRRYVERATDTINIKAYTNLSEVVLMINGEKTETFSVQGKVAVFEGITLTKKLNHIKIVGISNNEEYKDEVFYMRKYSQQTKVIKHQ
ncbi:glycoside hydrolase family 2 protein [Alkalicoccobacillus plakortidis]|uniref:Glycoside hydrolase family 2 protein n=1 Tax=Alkalicoccobacillus plakortidis TaxID=444060 RepID=A0ABT0XNG1_9BACI|nr:glycoside hydrolase family 2 TIM barrel-domain containing protein [Alkalicoccobacillus plakortidis]MCM2677449.1 glycoside hydrolase family 2 protein [Alkalicoccobacillus plakortidis]